MIQYRRISALLLGVWLGAGIFADVAVTQNFQTVDRFLAAPGSIRTGEDLNTVGRDRARVILRRNAGEENNFLFGNWERAELILGTALLVTLIVGERPRTSMIAVGLAMLLIVVAQHFFLSPQVAALGRKLADLPAGDPVNKTFWMFHGIYSGSEILKLLAGAGLAVRLSVHPKAKPKPFVNTYNARQDLATRSITAEAILDKELDTQPLGKQPLGNPRG